MCTAATYQTKDFYFGRTLDYEFSYGNEVTITPRNYRFEFRKMGELTSHYAIIGMAYVQENTPLYYDAINEKGLGMAGLNFVGNADYKEEDDKKDNVTPFEFISWILAQCATVKEARKLIKNMNLVKIPFSKNLPLSPLHWILADADECITVESVEDGIHVYDNQVGVLTNNPPFPFQMFSLNNYRSLSSANKENTFSEKLALDRYSRGMGAMGLPGDLSSQSRFVRVAFTKMNAISEDTEEASVSQFFHILGSVEQQRGCCEVAEGKYEITIYTSCCNATKGIYYYTTYENSQITAIDMYEEDLDGTELICYPLIEKQQIYWQNKKDRKEEN